MKNGWYKDKRIIPKNICSIAPEKSIMSFEIPFCIDAKTRDVSFLTATSNNHIPKTQKFKTVN